MMDKRLYLLLILIAAGCAGAARSSDARSAIDGGRDQRPDSPAADTAGQCCTVTLSGPGTENCPCTVQSIPTSCRDVGRTCTYEPCDTLANCTCLANEDGGSPLWFCGIIAP